MLSEKLMVSAPPVLLCNGRYFVIEQIPYSIALSPPFPYFLTKHIERAGIMDTDVITIRELAVYLKMAEKTLYRLASEGSVPGFKVGGAWRFRKSEIDKWIFSQERKVAS